MKKSHDHDPGGLNWNLLLLSKNIAMQSQETLFWIGPDGLLAHPTPEMFLASQLELKAMMQVDIRKLMDLRREMEIMFRVCHLLSETFFHHHFIILEIFVNIINHHHLS